MLSKYMQLLMNKGVNMLPPTDLLWLQTSGINIMCFNMKQLLWYASESFKFLFIILLKKKYIYMHYFNYSKTEQQLK